MKVITFLMLLTSLLFVNVSFAADATNEQRACFENHLKDLHAQGADLKDAEKNHIGKALEDCKVNLKESEVPGVMCALCVGSGVAIGKGCAHCIDIGRCDKGEFPC